MEGQFVRCFLVVGMQGFEEEVSWFMLDGVQCFCNFDFGGKGGGGVCWKLGFMIFDGYEMYVVVGG